MKKVLICALIRAIHLFALDNLMIFMFKRKVFFSFEVTKKLF